MIEFFVLKLVVAGVLVVLFSVLTEILCPHSLSGLLSAAPSIALANLGIAFVANGPFSVGQEALGMVAGGIAMIVFTIVAPVVVERWGALKGSSATILAWCLAALAGYFVVAAVVP